jgi:hypothetical protein
MAERKFKEGDKVTLTENAEKVARECAIAIGAAGVVTHVFPSYIQAYPYDVKFEGYKNDVPVAEDEIEAKEE